MSPFLGLLNISVVLANSNATIPAYELSALSDLYYSTNGAYWQWRKGYGVGAEWNFSQSNPNPCKDKWQGIACIENPLNSSENVVQVLALEVYSMFGTIPPSIGNFTAIRKLDLAINSLYGPIPDTIGRLTTLSFLFLSSNHLGGTIPESFGALTELATMNIAGNHLNGTIPTALANMQSCTHFEVSSNQLTGSLPHFVGDMPKISSVYFDSNLFNGTIPDSYQGLANLTSFDVSNNGITGTIPSWLGNLTDLTQLALSYNLIHGTIPPELGQLKHLLRLGLGSMSLTGTIPPELCNLAQMGALDLVNNAGLGGTIPEDIGRLQIAFYIGLQGTGVNGSIPDSLYNITTLTTLSISYTQISGTISPLIGNLNGLITLDMQHNRLHGSLPAEMGNMTALCNVYLEYNQLTGTLPPQLGKLKAMTLLELNNNYLDGTIPPEIGLMTDLGRLVLNNNKLSGTLPPDLITAMPRLGYFQVNYNEFSGSIPASYLNNSHTTFLYFDHNQLSGALPDCLNTAPVALGEPPRYQLLFLSLSSNMLTGALPISLSGYVELVELDGSDNLFSSSIPASLSRLTQLQILFINNNLLSGNLNNVFNSTVQRRFMNVDVSTNQITGAIPSAIFDQPSVQSFAAVSNCFGSAPLPAEMCQATSLITLALDGLMSAPSCRHDFFAKSTGVSSYWLSHQIEGGIPSCLFNLPLLSTLHLSGNGFSGSITHTGATHSSPLSDLSLSNNNLKGSIPSSLQYRPWTNLDLSYNKLGGTLRTDFYSTNSSESSLSLEVNRLSGDIPSSLKSVEHISMLDGNLFACAADRSSLPSQDSHAHDYECGSNTFNYSIYVWLSLVSCIALAVVIVVYRERYQRHSRPADAGEDDQHDKWRSSFSSATSQPLQTPPSSPQESATGGLLARIRQWLSVFHTDATGELHQSRSSLIQKHMPKLPNIQSLGFFLSEYRLLCLCIAVYSLLVMLPVNATLTSYYSTYTYEFAWTIGSVYLSGITPSVVLLVFIFAMLVCVVVAIRLYMRNAKESAELNDASRLSFDLDDANDHISHRWNVIQYVKMTAVILVDVTVIVGVNVAYVYIHSRYGSHIVQITQVAVALFKLCWNNFAVRGILNLNKQFLLENNSNIRPERIAGINNHVSVAVFVTLFNNLAAPFIATAFVSSNCFYDVVTTPADVTVTYNYATCNFYEPVDGVVTCIDFIYGVDPRQTSYTPPFTYSYQCSSTFITTYSSVYVFMYVMLSLLAPLLQCALLYVFKHSNTDSTINNICRGLLPKILKPVGTVVNDGRGSSTIERDSVTAGRASWAQTVVSAYKTAALSDRLFDCDVFVVQLLSMFAVLITFGVVFPPLAVVGLTAVFSITLTAQISIGRYVYNALAAAGNGTRVSTASSPQHHASQDVRSSNTKSSHSLTQTQSPSNGNSLLLSRLEYDCIGASTMFIRSLWILVPFVVVFYSFLLFDILGDETGWKHAIWMPICITAVPVLALVGRRWRAYTIFGRTDRSSRQSWGVGDAGERGGANIGQLTADLEEFEKDELVASLLSKK